MNTYQYLKDATSICTMSHESVADMQHHDQAIQRAAQMVDCGLITLTEAKRAIFQA